MENTNALEQVAKTDQLVRRACRHTKYNSRDLAVLYRVAIHEWNKALETGDARHVDNDALDVLTGGIAADLALRDALLISTVCAGDGEDPGMTMDNILEVIFNPRSKATASWVRRKLGDAFDSEERVMGDHRADAARLILSRAVVRLFEEDRNTKYAAQPLAMLAYIEWFDGNRARAFDLARAALEKDGDASLAAIVMKSVMSNLNPKYIDNEKAGNRE